MSAAKEEGKNRDYTVQTVLNVLKVVEFLAGGEILEWKTIREVAEATALTHNMSYRLLETLVAAGWAEKTTKGYRQNSKALARHAYYAKEYLDRKYAEMQGSAND